MSEPDKKTYATDIQSFDLDGNQSILNIVASVVVAPIRLVMKVLHNICILPAELMCSYAEGLLFVSSVLSVLGVLDLVIYRRWPLLISQLPLVFVSLRLRRKARVSAQAARDKKTVDIDYAKIEEKLNTVYDRIDTSIGKDDNK